MKRLALLLSVIGVLLLAACGGREDSPRDAAVVYAARLTDCGLEQVDTVDRCCTDGQSVWFTAGIRVGEEVRRDPETGEVSSGRQVRTGIYRVPLEGGPAEQLENYAPLADGSVRDIESGGDGTLWVTETWEERTVRRQLDGTGAELARQEAAGDKTDCFCVLPDGRVAALVHDWDGQGYRKTLLAVLTPTEAADLPAALTMACMGMPYTMREQILAFNRDSGGCRIDVVDYGEYGGEGLTRLNTALSAGNVPDLFYTENLPMDRYAAKGFLEDLWPYIEADPEIGGREGLMARVLDAASVDGRLYRAFDGFSIRTAAGPAAVVGDRMSWTLADLREALGTMPDGCMVFGEDDTREGMLRQLLRVNMSSFVDWSTGTCSFDSEEFRAQLAFCGGFPEEFAGTEESNDVRLMSGKQLLSACEISGGFQCPQRYDQLFHGKAALIGCPREDGGAGSCFCPAHGLAMSSACKDKDAAWSFVRRMFLPQADQVYYDADYNEYDFNGFPINRSDFDKCVACAVTPAYQRDGNGVIQTDENGEPLKLRRDYWYTGGGVVDFYAAAQEDVDRIMALYDSIGSVDSWDENIDRIIQEQAGAYFAGDKNLDAAAREIQDRVELYMGENM